MYTDVEGQLSIISEAIQTVAKNPESEVADAFGLGIDFEENAQFQDEDDEDNENAISVEKLKRDIYIVGSPDSELKSLDTGMKFFLMRT